uniref:Tetratricopeptide repeat protein 37 n=1 Tax=Trichuris muris TaxID=70415 RepID=A0A5S6QK87_TRIMR
MAEADISAKPKELLKVAKEKYLSGCFQEALGICKPLIPGSSVCYPALTISGMCATKLGDYVLAKQYLKKAVEINAESSMAWKALEEYYGTFYLYDDLYIEMLKFFLKSPTQDEGPVYVKKLFQALVKMKREKEAIHEIECFMNKDDKLSDFRQIAAEILDTLLAKVPCQYEAAVLAKKCYDILRQNGDIDLSVKEKYVPYIMESCLTEDTDKVLEEMYNKEPNSQYICQLYVRLLVERYLDGCSFVEVETVDLSNFLNELLEKINLDADSDPESQLWFQLGSALKEMEDLNFNLASARLTQQFDRLLPQKQPDDLLFTGNSTLNENSCNALHSRQKVSRNAMFCCGLLLLDLKLKMSDHRSGEDLVKRINSVKEYNTSPPRLRTFELFQAEIEAELNSNEESTVQLFEKIRLEKTLPLSLRLRATKRLAICLATQKRLEEAVSLLDDFEEDSSVLCIKARCYLISEEYKRAEELSRRAMELDSSVAEAPYLLSRAIYAQTGQSSQTLKLFVTAARLDPYNGDIFFWLGKILDASKKEKKALECFERAYKLKPYAEDIAVCLSDFYWRNGMHAKNIQLLEAISRLHFVENRSWAWFRLALQSLLHGSPVDSMQALQCILRTDSSNPCVMDLLADAYMRSGNLKSAMKSWRKCLTVETPAISSVFQLGNALLKGHSYEEARTYFERTLHTDGNFWPSLIGLASSLIAQGQLMSERGRWPKAFEYWRLATEPLLQSLKVNPGSCISWKYLGDCFDHVGRICDKDDVPSFCVPSFFDEWECSTFSCVCFSFVASLLYYKAALSRPTASGTWRCLALCLGRLARITQCKIKEKLALKVIRIALRISQLSVKNWTAYGVLASWSGRPRLAQHCFVNAIQLRINEGRAWANWGILCLRQEQVEQAYKALAQTQHTQPLSFYGWIGMAFVSIQAAPWDTQDLFRHCTTLMRHPVAANRYCYFFVKNYLKEARKESTLNCDAKQFIKYALDITSELCSFRTVDPSTYNNYGLLLEIDGNYYSAFQAYQKSSDFMKLPNEECQNIVLANMLRVCSKNDNLSLEHGEKLLKGEHFSRSFNEMALRALVMARLGKYCEAKSVFLNVDVSGNSSRVTEKVHLCTLLLSMYDSASNLNAMDRSVHKSSSPSRLLVLLLLHLKGGLPAGQILHRITESLPKFSESQKRLFFKIVTLYAKSFSVKEKQHLVEAFPAVSVINLLWLDCLQEFGVLDDVQIGDICKYKDYDCSWSSIPWFAWFALEKTVLLHLPGTVKWISQLYRLMPELNSTCPSS